MKVQFSNPVINENFIGNVYGDTLQIFRKGENECMFVITIHKDGGTKDLGFISFNVIIPIVKYIAYCYSDGCIHDFDTPQEFEETKQAQNICKFSELKKIVFD